MIDVAIIPQYKTSKLRLGIFRLIRHRRRIKDFVKRYIASSLIQEFYCNSRANIAVQNPLFLCLQFCSQ